jgi:hypothetical protein
MGPTDFFEPANSKNFEILREKEDKKREQETD